MNNKFVVSLIICVIAAGGLGFYGGTVYQKNKTPAAGARTAFGDATGTGQRGAFAAGQGGAAGRVGTAGAGGFSNGEVVSKDDTSVTLKLMDGGSKIVLFSSSTRVGKTTDGSAADLTTGTNVMVTGSANADGSITASNIQIRPAGDLGGRVRAGIPSGQPQPGQPAPQQP